MRTQELLEAARREISQKLFPGLKTCEVHDGRFDLGELRRVSTRTPAIFVACLGTLEVESRGTGQVDAVKQLAAYVITRNSVGLPRGQAARNLVDGLEIYLLRGREEDARPGRWGLSGVGPAERIRAQNLYSGPIDKQGIALWAVSWQQKLLLSTAMDQFCPPLPSQLYLGQEPEIGTRYEADYGRVE